LSILSIVSFKAFSFSAFDIIVVFYCPKFIDSIKVGELFYAH
jgi:hypothetical protein